MSEQNSVPLIVSENELLPIIIVPGTVTCDIEPFANKIHAINDYLRNMTVTEETLADSKKLLARVNKAIKELSSERIAAERAYLQPFSDIKQRIKELEQLAKEASETVRQQVRDFDEQQRELKRQELERIWNERIVKLVSSDFISFNDFLKPQHLNKSVTIKKVTEEMSEFLARTEKDIPKLITKCRENGFTVQGGLDIYKRNYNYGDFLEKLEELVVVEKQIQEKIDEPEVEEVYKAPDFVYFKVPYTTAGVVRNYLTQNSIPFDEMVE